MIVTVIIIIGVWVLMGFICHYETTYLKFNFKKYNREDWLDLIIDIVIGLPMYIKYLFILIKELISELWSSLRQ